MIIMTFGIVIALAAAARSTWSPCGLSMLSQITPLAEAGRGQRFGRTAAWFVAGATLGGIILGGAVAAGTIALSGVGRTAAIAIVGGGAFVAAAVDARVFGFGPPFFHRQVNDDWLSQYRPWVYGGGFGLQIGLGVTTYVMTAAVPLMIVVGILSRSPMGAIVIGSAFGLARGIAVLLGAHIRTPDALYAFHRRFDRGGDPVRRAVITVQAGFAAVAAWVIAPHLVAIGVSVAAVALLARSRPQPEPRTVGYGSDVSAIEPYISGRR